jgi:hypothetical protein
LAARAAGVALVTRDARALATYAVLGVDVDVVEERATPLQGLPSPPTPSISSRPYRRAVATPCDLERLHSW